MVIGFKGEFAGDAGGGSEGRAVFSTEANMESKKGRPVVEESAAVVED